MEFVDAPINVEFADLRYTTASTAEFNFSCFTAVGQMELDGASDKQTLDRLVLSPRQAPLMLLPCYVVAEIHSRRQTVIVTHKQMLDDLRVALPSPPTQCFELSRCTRLSKRRVTCELPRVCTSLAEVSQHRHVHVFFVYVHALDMYVNM